MQITENDRTRIAEAVARAEGRTSGEIRCVYTPYTDIPGQGPALIAAAASLVVPALALLLGLDPEMLAARFGSWSVGHMAAAEARIASTLTVYVLLQTAIFAIVYGLAAWRPVRRLFVPQSVRAARAHAAALLQFDALGLAYTRDKTGILLFVSDEDHHAEVLADEGIYAKAPREVWDDVVAVLVEGLKRDAPGDGFVAAVERTGEILASCLPPRTDDRNELPNALVEARPKTRGKGGKAAPKPRAGQS
jgi:putative membrane protein